jgi:ubiquinone/menaquinone biosynthesis C-methylase UbiE
MTDQWKVWDDAKEYGKVFFDRATGKMPEMESSKAAAKQVNKLIQKGDHILDIGCGGGHYLTSIDKLITTEFTYTGIDATEFYIAQAKKAFENNQHTNYRKSASFVVGDIFNLPVEDNSADIVMCNNVLLHLPSVEKPLSELIRVAKKHIIIRTLIGDNSFRTKHIKDPEAYDLNGEPVNFYFYNIYSEQYFSRLLNENPAVGSFTMQVDKDFDSKNIGAKEYEESGNEIPSNVTKVIDGMQINHYIIQPWQFLIITKK